MPAPWCRGVAGPVPTPVPLGERGTQRRKRHAANDRLSVALGHATVGRVAIRGSALLRGAAGARSLECSFCRFYVKKMSVGREVSWS
jgi:hypothetical protein